MAYTSPQVQDRSQRHLETQRRAIADFMVNTTLTTNEDNIKFNGKLLATLDTYQMELERLIEEHEGSQEWFEKIKVFHLMGLLLASRLIDMKRVARDAGQRLPKRLNRSLKFLNAAVAEFGVAHDDLVSRFAEPDFTASLPQKFQSYIPDMTTEDAEYDAVDIRSRIAAIRAAYTLEEIEARIESLVAAKATQ